MVVDSGTDETSCQLPDELSIDTTLRLLANQRRRHAISRLEQHERALSLADLAEAVATAENDVPLPDIDEKEVLHVYLSLYHNHIPRLADHEIVEYEQERDLVRLADGKRPVLDVISFLSDERFER